MLNCLMSGAVVLLFFLGPGRPASADEKTKDPLIVNLASSPQTLVPNGEYTLRINLQLPKGYHAYEDQFKITFLEPSGLALKKITLSPLMKWFDKFSKKERIGIEGMSTMEIVFESPDRFVDDNKKLVLELMYQACSSSFCLFPKSKDISIPILFSGNKAFDTTKITTDGTPFSWAGFSYYLDQIRQFIEGTFNSVSADSYRDVTLDRKKLWSAWSEEAQAQAKSDKKPLILDFSADWCAACLELDEQVFSSDEFAQRTKNIKLLKMDSSKNSDVLNRLKKKYGIVSLPTILFFNSNGDWIKEKTLTEFESKDKFLRRLDDFN